MNKSRQNERFMRSKLHHEAVIAIKRKSFSELQDLIAKGADPLCEDSEMLRLAAEAAYPEMVEFLIPLSNPLALESLALRWACEQGDEGLECVKLLLPHSNPKDCKSAALRLAVTYGGVETARLLFPLSNPKDVLSDLNNPHRRLKDGVLDLFHALWAEEKAFKQKDKLTQAIAGAIEKSAKKTPKKSKKL